MSKLQTRTHQQARSLFRILGPTILLAGIAFMIAGLASFFLAFGSFEPPRFFWCCFVGIPLLFVGSVLSMFGYMGAMTRYMAAEQTPVAIDTMNAMAEGTQTGVKTTARAVAEGVKEGWEEKRKK